MLGVGDPEMREVIGELKTWLGRAKSSRALLATWAIIAGCARSLNPRLHAPPSSAPALG